MTISKMTEIAIGEVGYYGKKNKSDDLYIKDAPNGTGLYNKYAPQMHETGYFNGNKQGQPWCAVFAHWIMLKTFGSKEEAAKRYPLTKLGASSYYTWNWFNKNGKASGVPAKGAFIFFTKDGTTDGIYHTGIVIDYNKKTGKVYTVEGNISNCVVAGSYDANDKRIAAYGIVQYDEEPEEWETIFVYDDLRVQRWKK